MDDMTDALMEQGAKLAALQEEMNIYIAMLTAITKDAGGELRVSMQDVHEVTKSMHRGTTRLVSQPDPTSMQYVFTVKED